MPVSFSAPRNRDARARGAGVTAVLGPTNTGKTHLAIERMLGHSSGVIGLPLRLLAREVYNKIVDRIGPAEVALVTGEEKIKPPNPRFWVSTVEAMPRDLDVAFLAVDEIQLGADLERGHVFTDRMLNMRGREETLVLGAATARPMVEKLLPGAHILSRPRLSHLAFSGERKMTRLPRRSAIVAFSADEVYAIAELIRRQRGGAAVVLGALSPRTRNAQVALYQSGDVDYLIATDAIGMGLNLDVEHVAFASDRKYDGYQFRRLNPAEFAQIAGRAGRAQRDGTFGTTGRCPPFEPELVKALESHDFEPLKVLQWRNTNLDFTSVGALQASLAMPPTEPGLTRAPTAEDILVLEHAARDPDVRAVATTRQAVERLWEVCQVPDYRRISPATHTELVIALYGFLMREGSVPTDWFARQVAQADHNDGDIDTLSTRLAHIRTWTFAANRPDWLVDPEHWQGVTRAVEDKLSDAMHERLTERFVDRRTSVLMRRLKENTMLETDIAKSGDVMVEGHLIGRLDGFQFAPDPSAAGPEAKTLRGAAQKALAGEIDQRATRLAAANDDQFVLASDGLIRWMGSPVGRLVAADDVLRPRVRLIADEQLTGASRDAVQARADQWLKAHIEKLLAPIFTLSDAEDVTGIARGVAFQLAESLGVIERGRVADEVKGLDQESRSSLRKYGVRFGAYHLYLPALLKPAPRALALQLWALKNGDGEVKGVDDVRALAASGRTSFPADKEVNKALYRTAGYRVCGERAVRVDILERLADLIRPALAWRPGGAAPKPAGAFDGRGFTITGAMTSLTGSSGEDFASILRSLGYRMDKRPKPQEVVQEIVQEIPQEIPAATEADAGGQPADAGGLPANAASVDAPQGGEIDNALAAGTGPVAESTDAPAEIPGASDLTATPAAEGIAPVAAPAPSPRDETSDQTPPAEATLDDVAKAMAEMQAHAAPVADAATPDSAAESASAAAPDADMASPDAAGPDVATAGAAPTAESAEPEMVDVWRPGRPPEERREHRRPPRGEQRDRRGSRQPSPVAASPDAATATGETPAPAAPESTETRPPRGDRRPRHGRPEHGRPDAPQGDRPPRQGERKPEDRREAGARSGRPNRSDRPDRQGREDRGRGAFGKGRSDEPREWRDPKEHRGREPDPNSPFAKLAALKAQLEAGGKDRQ